MIIDTSSGHVWVYPTSKVIAKALSNLPHKPCAQAVYRISEIKSRTPKTAWKALIKLSSYWAIWFLRCYGTKKQRSSSKMNSVDVPWLLKQDADKLWKRL